MLEILERVLEIDPRINARYVRTPMEEICIFRVVASPSNRRFVDIRLVQHAIDLSPTVSRQDL